MGEPGIETEPVCRDTHSISRDEATMQRQTTMGRKRQFDRFHRLVSQIDTKMPHAQLPRIHREADLYVVGGDQIWNVFYEAGRDPAFYLEFVTKGEKHHTLPASPLDIPRRRKKKKKCLRTFDAVSVREKSWITGCSGMNIPGGMGAHPVFLLP